MQHRYLCSEMITARFTEPLGIRGETAGTLEEVWETGACLQLEEPLEPGAQVRFRPMERRLPADLEGVVVTSRYEEGLGYMMEIGFLHGYRWSPRVYRPQHLLDPYRVKPKAPSGKTRAAAAGAHSGSLPSRMGVSRAECNRP